MQAVIKPHVGNLLELLSNGCEYHNVTEFSIYCSYENFDKLRKVIHPKIICLRGDKCMNNSYIVLDFGNTLLLDSMAFEQKWYFV